LLETYGTAVRSVGFSGHHKGIAIDMAAITLGATCIERHFTLDRTLKGTDHAASLEPDGLRKLKRDSLAVVAALKFKDKPILAIEREQRKKLKRRLGFSKAEERATREEFSKRSPKSDSASTPIGHGRTLKALGVESGLK
jgi:sialic acid synthase SpsE